MAVFISHTSALRFWLSEASGGYSLDSIAVDYPRVCDTRASDIDLRLVRKSIGNHSPIDILVPERTQRHITRDIKQHLWTDILSEESFVELGKGIYVASPSLCFIQAAPLLSSVELIALGFELCGSYRIANDDGHGFVKRDPLVSPEQLADYCSKLRNHKGLKTVRRALPWVLGGSASPMETALAMKTSLPPRLGGYGMPLPVLNQRIDLDDNARIIAHKSYLECDLFWPGHKLALEYDSDKYHVGPERIESDARRRDALAYMGIQTVTATRERVMRPSEFDALMRHLARIMHKRINIGREDFSEKYRELDSALFHNKTLRDLLAR